VNRKQTYIGEITKWLCS